MFLHFTELTPPGHHFGLELALASKKVGCFRKLPSKRRKLQEQPLDCPLSLVQNAGDLTPPLFGSPGRKPAPRRNDPLVLEQPQWVHDDPIHVHDRVCFVCFLRGGI